MESSVIQMRCMTMEGHRSEEQRHDYHKGYSMCPAISIYVQRNYGHHKHCLASVRYIQNLHLPTTNKFHIYLRSPSWTPTRERANRKPSYSIESHTHKGPSNYSEPVATCELWTSDLNLDRLDSWIISIYKNRQTPSTRLLLNKEYNWNYIEVLYFQHFQT